MLFHRFYQSFDKVSFSFPNTIYSPTVPTGLSVYTTMFLEQNLRVTTLLKEPLCYLVSLHLINLNSLFYVDKPGQRFHKKYCSHRTSYSIRFVTNIDGLKLYHPDFCTLMNGIHTRKNSFRKQRTFATKTYFV